VAKLGFSQQLFFNPGLKILGFTWKFGIFPGRKPKAGIYLAHLGVFHLWPFTLSPAGKKSTGGWGSLPYFFPRFGFNIPGWRVLPTKPLLFQRVFHTRGVWNNSLPRLGVVFFHPLFEGLGSLRNIKPRIQFSSINMRPQKRGLYMVIYSQGPKLF